MKSIYYTLSVTGKEIRILLADRGLLAVLLLLPILLGSLFAGLNLMLASDEGDPNILLEVILVNEDPGNFGGEVAKSIRSIDELNVKQSSSVSSAEQRVAEGEVAAAIIIPADFSENIDSYTPTEIEVIIDPAQAETASIVTGIVNQVAGEVVIWGEIQYGIRTIMAESDLLAEASPEELRGVEAQNLGVIMTQLNELRRNPAIAVISENLEGIQVQTGIELFITFLFPAFTVMFIFFIVGAESASLLQEREAGTLRRLLAAPLPRWTVIAGKMLAYGLLVCAQVAILFTLGYVAFNINLGRDPLALVAITLAVAFVAVSMGMIVAAFARSAKQADNVGMILAFVFAGIGGAFPTWPPLFRSGGLIGILSKFTPHAHALEGYYSVMAENAALTNILPQLGFLLLMGLVFFLIAVWRFKFE
ncbi:MAG: ABC transporter permease [Chloroflexota bacterium]|nr:MAG: ABC transporter permease [Chloroflexota bacterium]